MSRRGAEFSEIQRLYKDEGLSLRQVAARLGISFQAVHDRLVRAGEEMRPKIEIEVDRQLLKKLLVDEFLPIWKIAKTLDLSDYRVRCAIDKYGLTRPDRVGPYTRRKYSELAQLMVGESVIIPRAAGSNPYAKIYGAAARRGMRVSAKRVGKKRLRITRKA